jgi:hypothetical protein
MVRPIWSSMRAALAVLVLGALACAGTQKPEDTGPKLSKQDMRYTNVFIEPFTISAAGVAEKEPAPHVSTAQAACLGALLNSGLFDTVKVGAPPADTDAMVVKAELISLRIVGGGARFWLGGMAGKSDMKFTVTLTDARTGANLGRSTVAQDSNPFGGAWTMGATDRSVPGETGQAIAETVVFGAKK